MGRRHIQISSCVAVAPIAIVYVFVYHFWCEQAIMEIAKKKNHNWIITDPLDKNNKLLYSLLYLLDKDNSFWDI